MRANGLLLSSLFCCILTAGCATSSIKGYPSQFNEFNQNFLCQMQDELLLGSSSKSKCPPMTNSEQTAYRTFKACIERQDADAQKCRNNLMTKILIFIDLQYNQFRADLYLTHVGGTVAPDIAVYGLTAAGAVATGGASQILSGLAGAVTATRTSFSKDVLFNMTMPAIIQQMDNDRAVLMSKIQSGLKAAYDSYPLSQAISDANAYFLAGTLPGAINSLVAGKRATEERELIASKVDLEKRKSSLIEDCRNKYKAEFVAKLVNKLGKNNTIGMSAPDNAFVLEQLGWKEFTDADPAKPGSDKTLAAMASFMIVHIADTAAMDRVQKVVDDLAKPTSAKPAETKPAETKPAETKS